MANGDLKGILEVLVEEIKIVNGESRIVNHYKSTFGAGSVNVAFQELADEGKIKVLHPLGTTKETARPDNTYYISLPRR